MVISQQKFRKIVFQLLFSNCFQASEEEDLVEFMMAQLSVTKKVVKEAMRKWKAILGQLPQIDEIIRTFSLDYGFNRIAEVEKNVLRLSVYELYFEKEIPPKVVIAEGIRLTRKFSIKESSAFVNAVLDSLFQESVLKGTKQDAELAAISAE